MENRCMLPIANPRDDAFLVPLSSVTQMSVKGSGGIFFVCVYVDLRGMDTSQYKLCDNLCLKPLYFATKADAFDMLARFSVRF